MICAEAREYLFAFLDNELDAALSMQVQRHLERCPECAREAEIERTIGKQLGTTLQAGADAPSARGPALADALDRADRGAPAENARKTMRPALAAAACVAIGLAGLAAWRWMSPGADLGALVMADFVHFVEEGQPVQFATADVGKAQAWLRERTGVEVDLPAVDGDACRLVGVRKCTLAGKPTAFAVYEMEGTTAALAVMGGSGFDLSAMKRVQTESGVHWVEKRAPLTVLACRRGDRVYAAVSTLHETKLLELMPGATHESH